MHKIHSHSHLILDPESAYDDDLGGGFAPSEVLVKCRFRIQDQVAVDFMQKFLYFDKIKFLLPHNALYSTKSKATAT